jgi:hypothetical protein
MYTRRKVTYMPKVLAALCLSLGALSINSYQEVARVNVPFGRCSFSENDYEGLVSLCHSV